MLIDTDYSCDPVCRSESGENFPGLDPIATFIRAAAERDSDALLATFADDAAVADDGHTYRGKDAIRAWNDSWFLGREARLDVLDHAERDGATVLTILVSGDYAAFGITEPLKFEFHFTTSGNRITRLQLVEVED